MTPRLTNSPVSAVPLASDPEVDGSYPESNCLHQLTGQRRGDHRAAAEAHDRHAGGEAGTVREPLDERRDGRDVPDPQPDPADDAVAQVDQPQLRGGHADGADEEAEPPGAGRGEHRHPRSDPVDQVPMTAADRPRTTIAIEKTRPTAVSEVSKCATIEDL